MTDLPIQPWFPVWALPPRIRAAVEESIAVTQAPAALVAGSALATMSIAVQDKVRVRRLDGLVSGCSLFLITVSDSGERKTSVDRMFTKPIVDHQIEKDAEYREESEAFKVSRKIWEIEQKSLAKMLERAFSIGEQTEIFEQALAAHARRKPIEPRKTKYIYNDVTPAAFLHGLHSNSKSAGIFDDEAGRIISGPLVNDLGMFNKVWGGDDIQVDRRTSESFSVRDARVTVSWMLQEPVFARYLERKGDQARGIGFFARCLISRPLSTQGSRFINGPSIALESLPKFHRRVTELLQRCSSTDGQNGQGERIELHFSPEAQADWIAVFNQIEQHINPGGVFCQNTDYASKVAENIARVAAIFHYFEGYEGVSISLETLRSATTIVLWYAQEFVRLFSPPDPLHETIKDAYVLQDWLSKVFSARNFDVIQKNFVLQRGPNSLRSKDRLNWALSCLANANRIASRMQGRKEFILLNRDFFVPFSNGQEPLGFFPLR